jgi:hypothetical protein
MFIYIKYKNEVEQPKIFEKILIFFGFYDFMINNKNPIKKDLKRKV